MQTFIALFRGINVGGNNVLPMQDLVQILEGQGLRQVKTYIQSGNAVFRTNETDLEALAQRISAAIGAECGFTPAVMLLTEQALRDAAARNPFPAGEGDPKSLHLFFLAAAPPAPDLAGMESVKSPTEAFRLMGNVFYLHAPDGIGRSKLAAKAERLLGVEATARNWRTVSKLLALAAE